MSEIFVGVVKTHLAEGNGFWVTHGHQYVAFMDGQVVMGKVGVAAERPPHHVFSQQTLPEAISYHRPGVAEVCDAATELRGKSVSVQLSKALKGPAKANFCVKHVQVAVCVNETHGTLEGRLSTSRQPSLGSAFTSARAVGLPKQLSIRVSACCLGGAST